MSNSVFEERASSSGADPDEGADGAADAGAPVRILIVDDHQMVSQAFWRVVEAEPDLEPVAVAADVDDAERMCAEHRPDLVLMDVALPSGDGITCAQKLKELPDAPRVLILTGACDVAQLTRAVRAGCDGLLLKSASAEQLTATIRAVHRGEVAFSAEDLASIVRHAAQRRSSFDLSDRELEVLACLAEGLSTPDIGARLYISVHTVRTHVRHILEKLGAHSKLEAVVLARRHELVT